MLSSKPVPQCTAVRVEGGGLLTEECEVKARWAGYFDWLYQGDPPAVELGNGKQKENEHRLVSLLLNCTLWFLNHYFHPIIAVYL